RACRRHPAHHRVAPRAQPPRATGDGSAADAQPAARRVDAVVIVASRRLSVAPARTIGGGLLVLLAGALVVGVGPDGAAADELVTREVAVRAEPSEGFGPPPPVVDRLPARTVLRITATGFEPNAAGVIEQCAASGCTNPFPVAFDATG